MKLSKGTVAWFGLAAYVVGYDVYAIRREGETLSSAFAWAVKHPGYRWPVGILWGLTTLHLFDLLPSWFDPFVWISEWLRNPS